MVITFNSKTDIGKRRSVNEDRIWPETGIHPQAHNPHGLLFLVADGLGGHGKGDLASQLAIETIVSTYYDNTDSSQTVPQRLERAFLVAHTCIRTESQKNLTAKSMGTTAVAGVIKYNPGEQTGRLWVAWVGDSRAYHWSKEEGLQLLTEDHSKLWPEFKAGEIEWATMHLHPERSILTNSLTAQREVINVSQIEHKLYSGDQVLLCSDGLSSEISNKAIEQALETFPPEVVGLALIEQAKAPKQWLNKDGKWEQSQGGDDNISVIVISLPDGKPGQIIAPMTKPTSIRPAHWAWVLFGGIILLLLGLGLYYLNNIPIPAPSEPVTPLANQPTVQTLQPHPVIINMPTDTPTSTATSLSELPTATQMPPTATRHSQIPTPRLATLTPTPTSTFTSPPDPTATPTITPTVEQIPVVPDENLGQIELIYPTRKDELAEGLKQITFQWYLNDQCNLSKDYGFDIRVAVAGETMQGVMDAVRHQDEIVCNHGERTYTVGDFMSVPGIDIQTGWFEWEVRLVSLIDYDKDIWIRETGENFKLGTALSTPPQNP